MAGQDRQLRSDTATQRHKQNSLQKHCHDVPFCRFPVS